VALGRLLAIGGAAGLVIALLMPWYGRRPRFDDRGTDIETFSAFQQFAAVDIALLAMAAGVVAALALGPALSRRSSYLLTGARHQGELYAALAALVIAVVALVLVLIKVAGPVPEETFVLRYGARFAVFCAAVTVAGALVCVCAAIERVLASMREPA
jgi:hypothetical protein